jgi:hypothetical protein
MYARQIMWVLYKDKWRNIMTFFESRKKKYAGDFICAGVGYPVHTNRTIDAQSNYLEYPYTQIIFMHNETSGSATNYERQPDTAFTFMNTFGYPSVKTGYVEKIIPQGENQDGQGWLIIMNVLLKWRCTAGCY